ncbi:MAG: hypothetical protein JXR53_06345 [Bacteroidales bacterium]|nr:hypothetical protein [Bacteroidales bacterium]
MKYLLIFVLAISCVRNTGTEEEKILKRYLNEISFDFSEGKELLIIIPETYCGGCVSHFLFKLNNQLLEKGNVTIITCGNVNLPKGVEDNSRQIVDTKRIMLKYDLGLENINIYEIEDSAVLKISHFMSDDLEVLDGYIVKVLQWLNK